MLRTLQVDKERMYAAVAGDFASATDLADYLVRKGLPFREAHAVVGKLVGKCVAQGRRLVDLTVAELQEASPFFGPEALELLPPENCVAARTSRGGTAAEAVEKQLQKAREILAQD